MHRSLFSPVIAASVVTLVFSCAVPSAADTVPAPAASAAAAGPAPASSSLPLIGRVRAVTPFCRSIVDHTAALADDQLADIRTTTEVLSILVYAPLDRDVFTEQRAVRALQTLSGRLMTSRRGDAQVHVAQLRLAAHGTEGVVPRPELARFASALDGAHSESSRVAHEVSRALTVLAADELSVGGTYLPDYQAATDPRFARAETPVPFPVDDKLERFSADRLVENGPLHAYARSVGLDVAASLDSMLGSLGEARGLFEKAFAGCMDVDESPAPASSAQP